MTTQPKSRLVKLTLASLATAVALGGAAGTVAYASGQKESAAVAALGQAKLSLADAIRAAADQGVVVGAEFEVKKDGAYFDVTTWRDGVETDHRIDPMSGAILASVADVEESDGDEAADEAREQAAIAAASVSLLDAVTAAEARGGTPLAVEFEDEDGALAIELEVADASGRVAEATVDAHSGAVIAEDADGEEADD